MTKRLFVLVHDLARQNAIRAIQEAPAGYVASVGEAKKRRIQEEKYHAMFGDIARQCEHFGRKLTLESWKRLLVEAFVMVLREEAKAQGKPDPFPDGGMVLPSLDGLRIVQVEVLTRDLTVKQASDLIEYLFSFGAERGVQWSDAERAAA